MSTARNFVFDMTFNLCDIFSGYLKFMRFLLDNKFLGNKTGKGFYEKTKEKDKNGKTL